MHKYIQWICQHYWNTVFGGLTEIVCLCCGKICSKINWKCAFNNLIYCHSIKHGMEHGLIELNWVDLSEGKISINELIGIKF